MINIELLELDRTHKNFLIVCKQIRSNSLRHEINYKLFTYK